MQTTSTQSRWQKVILALSLALTLLLFAPNAQAEEPQYGGNLIFATMRDATGFDPHLAGGTHNNWLLGNIYDNLVAYDLDGNIVPSLAEDWEYENERTLYMTLRDDVYYHNGQHFTAADVVATIDRIRNPETMAARASVADNVTEIEVIDDFHIRFHLEEPNITLLNALASENMFIVSAEDIENGENFDLFTNGTGPFYLESWEPDREYVLASRRGDYWGGDVPYLDSVTIRIIPDDRARVDALRSGSIHVADYVPWQDFASLEGQFEVEKWFSLNSHLRLNPNSAPFDNPLVRQAFGYIFDRDEVNDLAFGGEGTIMTGPLMPAGNPYYQEQFEGYYTLDHEKAKTLLVEAGYAEDLSDFPTVRMHVSTSAVATQPGLVVQQQLLDFGINVEWVTQDVPTLQENRRNGTYQLMMDGGGLSWPDPDYLRNFYHSEEGTNFATGVNYVNEELDALLEHGYQISDYNERMETYARAEEILLEDAVVHYFVWRPQADAIAPSVVNYPAHGGGLGTYNASRFEITGLDE